MTENRQSRLSTENTRKSFMNNNTTANQQQNEYYDDDYVNLDKTTEQIHQTLNARKQDTGFG